LEVGSKPSSGSGVAASALIEVPAARLVCLEPNQVETPLPGGGQIHLAAGSEQIVGRDKSCTYPINSRKLSRQHARIFPGVGVWGVEDLNSTNGVQVNREKIKTAWLKDGDEVRFGSIPFKFEILKADNRPVRAASAAEESEGERTMMVGSLGASKAVIEAERKKEAPPPEPVRPVVSGPANVQEARKGAAGRLITMLAVGAVVAVVVVGGGIYYPIFMENQKIADTLERNEKQIQKVISKARNLSGNEISQDKLEADLKNLEPVNQELWDSINQYPERIELVNAYARAQVLMFERAFLDRFSGATLEDAANQAQVLKRQLKEIAGRLPASVDAKSRKPLEDALGIADMAEIMVAYRGFSRRYPQIGAGITPSADEFAKIDARKTDLENYRKELNSVLAGDYRIFDKLLREFLAGDWPLVSRWRDLMRSGS
jgi:pSer/pThr/pTyr-binding forkhead associated (FHA) protein